MVIVKKYKLWNRKKKNSSSKDNVIKLVFKNIINKSVTNQFISCMVVIPIYFLREYYQYILVVLYMNVIYTYLVLKKIQVFFEGKKRFKYWSERKRRYSISNF